MTTPTGRKITRHPHRAPVLYAGGEAPRYGIGVQFSARDRSAWPRPVHPTGRGCDFCEQRDTGGGFHLEDNGLLLCPDCRRHLEALPECIQAALVRFLLGNVV